MITADNLLLAIEGGDLESILEDGLIVVLIDLKDVLHVPALPTPQISVTPGNAVVVVSGTIEITRLFAENKAEAILIADSLAACFENAR